MAWSTPRTWTSTILTASDLNTDVRDNLNILKTRIADNGNPLWDRAGGAAKTTTYNATTADVMIDAGGSSAWTLTLYAVSGNAGRVLFVKNTGTAVVTIDGNASETIDGALTLKLAPYESVILWCSGSAWFTLAEELLVVQESIVSFATADATTNTAYEDMTGFSTSFTPKLDNSTIEVEFHSTMTVATQNGSWRLVYGAGPTQIVEAGLAIGTTHSTIWGSFAPASTSAVTIKLQGKIASGGTLTLAPTISGQANGVAFMKIRERR